MAEREGFEPSLPVKVNTLSRRADSTTLPPLQMPFCALIGTLNRSATQAGFGQRRRACLFGEICHSDFYDITASTRLFQRLSILSPNSRESMDPLFWDTDDCVRVVGASLWD